MREFTPNRPVNVHDLSQHIGQYVTVARTIRPQKIVSATRTELKTEGGVRVRFSTGSRFIRVSQVGCAHFDPQILTEHEAAMAIQRADMNERAAARAAYAAHHRMTVAEMFGSEFEPATF